MPPPVTEPTRSSRVSHATHRVAGSSTLVGVHAGKSSLHGSPARTYRPVQLYRITYNGLRLYGT